MKHAIEKAVKAWEFGALLNYVMQFFNKKHYVDEKLIKKALEYRGVSNIDDLAEYYKKETYFGAAKAFYEDYMCLRNTDAVDALEYLVDGMKRIKK